MDHYIENLKWRYATKKFDATKKLSDEQLELLIDSLVLSPSSYGLQPWKFYVVENEEIRKRMWKVGYNQNQILDASHVFVLASRKTISDEDVARYIHDIAHKRSLPVEALSGFQSMMLESLHGLDERTKDEWTARQVYIALGFLLSAAAQHRIDACPMEGFDVEKMNELLGIARDGYCARVLCPVGFRSDADEYQTYPKVRFDKERIVERK